MKISSWLRQWFGPQTPGSLAGGKRKTFRKRPLRLELEALEHRLAPATLIVNSNDDNLNGVSSGPGADDLTLREAILLVNNSGDANAALGRGLTGNEAAQISGPFGAADTIQFNGTLTGQTILLRLGVLSVTNNLTITGLGSGNLAVSGDNISGVFQINAGPTVAISGLTIANGRAVQGAGIFINTGTLNLTNSTLSGNQTTQAGGGIFNNNNGTLFVTNVLLSNNSAGNSGGAIFNNGGTATVDTSIISNNSANFSGGGLFNANLGTNSGLLNLTNSTVSGNTATNSTGGGIGNNGTAILNNTTVSGNFAPNGSGGGIGSQGSLTLLASTVSGNTAAQSGGGIIAFGGGDLKLTDSFITGNAATNYGAGIYNSASATLTGSTVSSNTLAASGSPVFHKGGGIYNSGTLAVANSTVAANRGLLGAGIYNTADNAAGNVDIVDSLISGNTGFVGGGIANGFFGEEGGTVALAGSTVSGNTAEQYGGGIYNTGSLALTDNTHITANHSDFFGGGLYNRGSATATLTNSAVKDNTASSTGAGVYNQGQLNLINSLVTGNIADSSGGGNTSGGGIYNYGTATLERSTVSGNSADSGGGIANVARYISGAGSFGGILQLTNSIITGNAALLGGGGILNYGSANLDDSTVSFNTASNGAGIRNKDRLILIDSHVTGNIASNVGGGLYNAETATFTNTTVTGNSAKNNGGGIHNHFDASLNLTDSTIANNTASDGSIDADDAKGDGGGIANFGDATLTDSTISGNTALSDGGGIFNAYLATMALDLSTVSANTTFFGAGAGIFNQGTAHLTHGTTIANNHGGSRGAGIFNGSYFHLGSNHPGVLTITDTTISGNHDVERGGGLYNSGNVSVTTSTLSGNTADSSGGAMFNYGTAIVNNCTFDNNDAYRGGAIFNSSVLTITGSTLDHNTASDGGGIYNRGGDGGAATLTLINSTLSGNQAISQFAYGGFGGAIFNRDTVTLINSTISGNSADTGGGGIDSYSYTYQGNTYGSTTLHNTIVAGNLKNDTPDDIQGTIAANSKHNLIGAAGSAGGLLDRSVDSANGNIVGINGSGARPIATILDPTLSDNGGPTKTLALIAGSPALEGGDSDLAVDAEGQPLDFDQRGTGFQRIRGIVDIGAFEFPNATPVLTAPADQSAIEGTTTSFNLGSFTDDTGPWTITVLWGDGQQNSFSTSAQGTLTLSHSYANNTTPSATGYTVTVTVTDSQSAFDTESFQVVVSNASPVIQAAAHQTAVEAVAKSFNLGSFTDLGVNDQPWTVSVDWGDNSPTHTFQVNSPGSLGTLTHTFQDNATLPNSGFTVTVKVTDKDGGSDSKTYLVVVGNQSPSATITPTRLPAIQNASGPPVIAAGMSQSFLFKATDPSPIDDPAGFKYVINWGDGSSETINLTAGNGAGVTKKHVYTTPGFYTATVTALDKDNGSTQAAVTVEARKPLNLFTNGSFVDNEGGPDSEASNLQNTLLSLGYDLYDQVDGNETDFRGTFVGKRSLVLPELESIGDVLASIGGTAPADLREFVSGGGTLIVFGQGNLNPGNTASFLNSVFGVFGVNVRETLVGQFDDGDHTFALSSTDAAGTTFASGPASLRINDSTSQLLDLPEGARRLYSLVDSGGTEVNSASAAVVELPIQNGQIVYIGWDWFNADASYQDKLWFNVLDAAIKRGDQDVSEQGLSAFDSASFPLDAQLPAIVAAARDRWQQAGLTDRQLGLLDQITFSAANLSGQLVQIQGNQVRIDQGAGGLEWFIDGSPLDDGEFSPLSATSLAAISAGPAAGKFDLLTTVMRAMGQYLGVTAASAPDLMGQAAADSRSLPPRSSQYQLAELREMYGFYVSGGFRQNLRREQEKWIRDRTGAMYALTTTGDLIKWDGKSWATSKQHPLAHLGAAVYKDPYLLLKAPVYLAIPDQEQLAQLQDANGFRTKSKASLTSHGPTQKWFQDSAKAWFVLTADGTLRKWNGKSLATSKVIAHVSGLVFDNPDLLFKA